MPTKWPAINIWLRDICPRHGRCGPVLPIAVSLHALQRACLAWVLYLWSASVTTWLYAASTSTFPRSKFCWIRSTDPTFVGSWRVLGATMSGRRASECCSRLSHAGIVTGPRPGTHGTFPRSEEHTSELQSLRHLVCRLL